ncbi:MAG: DPP IV N-terminal domain-containing protein [Chitinophagaceae bacterium]|nr:DPP IV N-terminal domain-containing protein [Chitinophagaceae bacterium]
MEDIRLTNDSAKEINQTLSPDGNYVAYTKNNDLYTVNLATKKETRLTKDGSETILNGYASWVYMEEILGRSGRHRAFWWSPDSKHIAFFRFDDTNIPILRSRMQLVCMVLLKPNGILKLVIPTPK